MAEILNHFDFQSSGKPYSVYPWHIWFDGQIYRLKYGEDFHNEARNFRITVSSAARRLGIRVKTSRDGNDIVIQAIIEKGN